jgi:hypothetical protein
VIAERDADNLDRAVHLRTITDRLRHKLNRTVRRGAVLVAAAMVAVFGLPSAAIAEDNYYNAISSARRGEGVRRFRSVPVA